MRGERAAREERKRLAHERRLEPAITRDGHPVEIAANIGAAGETPEAVALGAEGIGLLRTELVFMNHAQAPDQATQEAEYRRVLEALEGRPLVVRTLDVGGDNLQRQTAELSCEFVPAAGGGAAVQSRGRPTVQIGRLR